MRQILFTLLVVPALLSVGCDEEKADINRQKEATKDAIDERKNEVDAAAKKAIERTERDATIEKARIKAEQDSIQAQLEADKKKAEAEAEAAKARADAENN